MKTIVLAGRCILGVEHYLKKVSAVTGTVLGYINGNLK